jgi:hypothetical protein
MGAQAKDALQYSSFPGMTYQTGLGPVSVISGTAPADTSILFEIDLGGAVGTATFKWSLDDGATWEAENQLTATSNGVNSGITMTWGAGSNLVLGAKYRWNNTVVPLSSATTKSPGVLKIDFLDVETGGGIFTCRAAADGHPLRTFNVVDGESLELDVYEIVSVTDVNKIRVYWGDY